MDDHRQDSLEALIELAERDIDAYCLGDYELLPSGLTLDPEELTDVQRAALMRATCWQGPTTA